MEDLFEGSGDRRVVGVRLHDVSHVGPPLVDNLLIREVVSGVVVGDALHREKGVVRKKIRNVLS
jgi:hypothetical protein